MYDLKSCVARSSAHTLCHVEGLRGDEGLDVRGARDALGPAAGRRRGQDARLIDRLGVGARIGGVVRPRRSTGTRYSAAIQPFRPS